jgi:hypothetical protein
VPDSHAAGERGEAPDEPDQRARTEQRERDATGVAGGELGRERGGDRSGFAELGDRRCRGPLAAQSRGAVCPFGFKEPVAELVTDRSTHGGGTS